MKLVTKYILVEKFYAGYLNIQTLFRVANRLCKVNKQYRVITSIALLISCKQNRNDDVLSLTLVQDVLKIEHQVT